MDEDGVRVAVLGCGPAGLMSAQAVVDACERRRVPYGVVIYSRKIKSPLHGCQYLHRPIPGVTQEGGHEVSYMLRGNSDDYRTKVYGQGFMGSVSPEDLAGDHMAWDLRQTYDTLWDRWKSNVVPMDLYAGAIQELSWADLIISSVPRPILCKGGHFFNSTDIIAAGDAPELGITIPFKCPEDTVVCNAEEAPSWYRMSRVFGHTTVEWPGRVERVPVATASSVQKPTNTNCDCWPNVFFVGRYGKWEKGVLSSDAYYDSYTMIDGSSALSQGRLL